MTSLVKVFPQGVLVGYFYPVSSVKLHTWLGVKTHHKDWVKRRVEEYGFEQGIDFELRQYENCRTGQGCSKLSGYTSEIFFTLGAAKEAAMVEKTSKGKEVRKYFLECERKLLEKLKIPKQLGTTEKSEYGTKWTPKVSDSERTILIVDKARDRLGLECTGKVFAEELDGESLLIAMIEFERKRARGVLKGARRKEAFLDEYRLWVKGNRSKMPLLKEFGIKTKYCSKFL